MNKLKTLLFIVLVLFFSTLLFLNFQTKKQENHAILSAPPSQELSQKEYKEIRNKLIDIVLKQDPRVSLATLREQAKTNEAIARSCHDLVHEIGHESYEKYGDFGKAMQYQDDMCNSGYLHGIIESHFAQSQDIFSTMKTVCGSYDVETFIGWECFHGVGHGLMYFTENDLPKSLSLCDTYTNRDEQGTCINGVFMENFNVDQKVHISKYVKANEPFYPCTEEKIVYKADCYLYAPTYFLSLHKNDYTGALNVCKTAEKDYRLICTQGVGGQAIKEHINNPALVESICMQGSSEEKNACIVGMVGLYMNHFGGIKEAKQLCTKLEKSNQQVCQETITLREGLF